MSSEHVYGSMPNLLDSLLCSRGFEVVFHNYKFVMAICLECELARFKWCPKELSTAILIHLSYLKMWTQITKGMYVKERI